MRKDVAAQKDIHETPQHRRYEEQDKERVPPIPGATARRGDNQRYINSYGNYGE